METEPKIIDSYVRTGKVRLVYRHLAQISDVSVLTGEGSECAADQGTFWEMRAQIYGRQSNIYSDPTGTMDSIAKDLGMTVDTFRSCVSGQKHRQFVLDDYNASKNEGVRSRPEFRLNGTRLVGALPFAEFQQRIEAATP